jgi:hypothetical protein
MAIAATTAGPVSGLRQPRDTAAGLTAEPPAASKAARRPWASRLHVGEDYPEYQASHSRQMVTPRSRPRRAAAVSR